MNWRALTVLLATLIGAPALGASTFALDNILVSKTNGVGSLQIWPSCRMRYVSHDPAGAGVELRIEVQPQGDCGEFLAEVSTEHYQPAGRRLANVESVSFDTAKNGKAFITVRFDKPSSFEVQQRAVGWIEISVDTAVAANSLPASVPPPLERRPAPPVARTPAAPIKARPRPARQATTQVRTAPTDNAQYAIQLGVFDAPDAALAALSQTGQQHLPYLTEIAVNGRTWHGLQIGFFTSEADADAVLADVRAVFPDSWVRVVATAEADEARRQNLAGDAASDKVVAVRVSRAAPSGDAELARQMATARKALLERRYDQAITQYTEILSYPEHPYRARAREYLAVALERSGAHDRALVEYQAYLAEFSETDDVSRVQTRLRTLDTALHTPDADLAAAQARASTSASDGWQIFGGVSQFYWRNQEQLVHEGNHRVSSSGVLALGDVTAVRRGERYDLLARVNGAYQYNLVDFDDDGNVGWLSHAYLDVADRQLGIRGTVGRQTRRQDGVPDRFDGIGVTYNWRPDISFSASAGFPVDSPRYTTGGQRVFYAASAQIENLLDALSVNVYAQNQLVDGILDRQAVGSEVQYQNGRLNVVGLVDFDISYSTLNTALINGGWVLENGWRLNGLLRVGAQPYLTTRNALAGQTVSSIDELLNNLSEGQIRTLARDRTADALTASAGLAVPLTEQLELSFDVTNRESDATRTSAGVAGMPASGAQMFYNLRIIGSSLLRPGDLNVLTLRHDATRTRNSSSILLDARLPFSTGLRINPRLMVARRTDNRTNTNQLIAKPSIRVIYRWQRLMLDVEAGGYWSDRDLPPTEIDPFTRNGTEELTGGFINAGYRWEF